MFLTCFSHHLLFSFMLLTVHRELLHKARLSVQRAYERTVNLADLCLLSSQLVTNATIISKVMPNLKDHVMVRWPVPSTHIQQLHAILCSHEQEFKRRSYHNQGEDHSDGSPNLKPRRVSSIVPPIDEIRESLSEIVDAAEDQDQARDDVPEW
jgi:hypothetical protein